MTNRAELTLYIYQNGQLTNTVNAYDMDALSHLCSLYQKREYDKNNTVINKVYNNVGLPEIEATSILNNGFIYKYHFKGETINNLMY